jgi:molybdopterin-guanine dinucleotide biosynthesis protein
MKIILITGWSGSGKDTIGEYLTSNHGFIRFAFADEIKYVASQLYRFPRALADTQEGKRRFITVGDQTITIRDTLIRLAAVDKERFGNTIYAESVARELAQESSDARIVITDLRYMYEYTTIREQFKDSDVQVWKIIRPSQTESPVKDSSEHSMNAFIYDVLIENTTLENLYKQIEDEL